MPDIGVRVRLLTEDGETAAHGLADALGVVDQKGKETQAQIDRVSAAAKIMGGEVPARQLLSAAIAAQKFGVEAAAGSRTATQSAIQLKLKIDQVRASIEAARASGGPVDPRWTAALAQLEAGYDKNLRVVGAFKRAQEDVANKLRDSTRAAGGLGGGLNSVSDVAGLFSSRAEQMALQLGLVTGAIYVLNSASKDAIKIVYDLGAAAGASGKEWDRSRAQIEEYTSAAFSLTGVVKVLALSIRDAAAERKKLIEGQDLTKLQNEIAILEARRAKAMPGLQQGASVTDALHAKQRADDMKSAQRAAHDLDVDFNKLVNSGTLTSRSLVDLGKRAEDIRAKYDALGVAVPVVTEALYLQKVAVEKNAKAVKDAARDAEQAANQEKTRIALVLKATTEADHQREGEQRLVAILKDSAKTQQERLLLYDQTAQKLAEEKELRDALQHAHGAEIAAITETITKAQELNREKETLLRLEEALHGVGPTLDFRQLGGRPFDVPDDFPDVDRGNTDAAGALWVTLRAEVLTARQIAKAQIDEVNAMVKEFPASHRVAAKEIARIHAALADEMISRYSAALSGLQEFVGLLGRATGNSDRGGFQAAQQILGNVQGVISTYQNMSKLAASAGMSASAASSVGYVAAVFAIWAAIYEGVSAHIAKSKSKKFSAPGKFEITDGAVGVQEVTEHAHAVNQALQQSIDALEEIFRGSVQQLEQISIRVRNDGNRVSAYVGETFVGYFSSIESAISASIAAALRTAELSTNVSPLIVAALRNTMAQTVEELAAQLGRVQEIADLGLDPVAIQVQRINMHFDELARTVTELRLGMQAAIDVENGRNAALLAQRDAITGTVRSEREIRLAQMAAFNSEILARRAVILALIAELQARLAVTRLDAGRFGDTGDGGDTGRGGGGGEGGVGRGGGRGEGGRKGGGIFTPPPPEVTNPAYQALLDALAAAFAALAGLPALIAESEIQIRRSQGRQRREGREAIQAEAALFGLSDFAASLADTRSWLDDFKESVRTAGFSAAESARLVAEATEEAARRIAEAMAEQRARLIDPYLGGAAGSGASQFAEQLRQSREDYAGMRVDGASTGVPAWQVNQAEANRNLQIGLDAMSSLGIASANAAIEANSAAATLAFLRENMAALGLTAAEVAAAAQEVSTGKFLGYAEKVAQWLGDEALLAELQEARYDMEKAQMAVEIEIMHAKGVLLDAEYNRILDLIGRLPADLPGAGSAGGGTRSGDLYTARMERQDKAAQEMAKAITDAAKRWEDSTQKLIDFQKSFLLSDLSPLSPRAKLDEAQAQYDAVFAAARRGDVEAREQFAEVAKALASESKGFYATSEGYTQGPATQIQRDLSTLIGQSGPYSIGNAVFGAFQQSSAPVVQAVKDTGTKTTVHLEEIRDELVVLNGALVNGGNQFPEINALVGQIGRLTGAIESLVRRSA